MKQLLLIIFLSSCGYRPALQERTERSMTVSVPYIVGDEDSILHTKLIEALSTSGKFTCVQSHGEYLVQVHLLSDEQERIGFRYDRDNPAGKMEKNLLGVESRRKAAVEVSLVETSTGKVVAGPFLVRSSVDFDYTNSGSPRDLLFAQKVPIMQFSLGQLDSSQGAFDDSLQPLACKLSQEIAFVLQERVD